ncbi:hypothetical protein JAAARDRAFT_200269 [Jaapia argillacea MUCL 33604]|uniref:Uncharacterized protein n=1 Tax=Jaapia argillacea MUCL 33604 TaxID=933084 RepID=A0A067PHZ6_9AGAM|nr:hypothetical protein JAAARDRAFT_200269 [Jaapia argillacea MUCL 33604]
MFMKTNFVLAISRMESRLDKFSKALTDAKVELEHQVAEFNRQNKALKKEVELLKVRMEELEDRLVEQQDEDENEDDSAKEKRLAKYEASNTAYKDNNLKGLTQDIFELQLGVGKLTAEYLPDWPADESTWLVDPVTGDKLLHFRWDQPFGRDNNWSGICIICEHIKKKGATYLPAAQAALDTISDNNLQSCVVEKFKDLAKKFKTHCAATERSTDRRCWSCRSCLTRSARQSWQKGVRDQLFIYGRLANTHTQEQKCDVRKWKQETLPQESKYCQKKYDSAFVANLMSDDKDEVGEDGKQWEDICLIIKHIDQRWSVHMDKMFETVDAQDDPRPAKKYTICVDGTEIAENGKLWGDDEDPEELKQKKWAFEEEKEEVKHKKVKVLMELQVPPKSKMTRKQKQGKGKGKEKAMEPPANEQGDEDDIKFDEE